MSRKGSRNKTYFLRSLVCLILISASSACVTRAVDELTFKSPYAGLVGVEFRVIGEVNAYGIYESLNKKAVSYITLIPGVGIAGPEVAFKRRIANGQVIRVLSAWRQRKTLSSNVYYLISARVADLPRNVPVRIDLSRGNEGVDVGLNPNIYESVQLH